MTAMTAGLRRTTGGLFVTGALSFAGAATVLSSTFDSLDVLREPADVVLPAFVAGGTSLVWTWFATAWTYTVPPVLLRALGVANAPMRELVEMQYQFEEPFIVDSSKITNKLGATAAPVGEALGDTLREYRRG